MLGLRDSMIKGDIHYLTSHETRICNNKSWSNKWWDPSSNMSCNISYEA